MRAVNLLPRQASSGKSFGFDRTLVAAIGATVLVVIAIGGGFFLAKAHAATASNEAAAAQAALDQARSQQTTHSPPPAQLQVPVVLSQAQPWHLALDSALSTRVSWDILLEQLEYVVPSTVTLSNVTLGSAPDAASGTIALGGTAYSPKDVAIFLSALARVPKVSQVHLTSSATEVGKNDVTFQITAQMTLPAPAIAPVVTSTTGAPA